MIDFPTAKHKLSFFMDRKDQRMTIDINSGQKVYSKHFQIDSLNETTTIRSLALLFRQENVTIFIDCKKVGVQSLDVSMTKLYSGMEEPVLKIVSWRLLDWSMDVNNTPIRFCFCQFRERKYPLHFDSSVADALWRANCHKSSGRRENRRYVKEGSKNRSNSHKHYFQFNGDNLINDQAAADKNRKRHIRDWQQEQSARNINNGAQTDQRRGDIQVVSGDCDGKR